VRKTVIFLDAVGTLFGVKDSVGHAYSTIAQEFGLVCEPRRLDQAFRQVFAQSPSMVFPHLEATELLEAEYQWWQEIALKTFAKTGYLQEIQDFPKFFARLFNYFAGAQPWFIYADTLPALESWLAQGYELGIISNFDSRLFLVLAELHLRDYFRSITISTEACSAKPDSQIFRTALAKHDPSGQFFHIGDSYEEDYQGACGAGLQGIWLDRDGQSPMAHIRLLTEFQPY
jgi:putative hydrolase of the HAD superfamily